MTGTAPLRVGSYNLLDGGIDHGDDSRLRRQLRILAEQHLHVVGLQEAKNWGPQHLDMAAHALHMTPYLAPSAHHGCHLVILIDDERVTDVQERHESGFPYWHAVACLRTKIDSAPVDLLNTHLAPSSPAIRRMEAEALRLFVKDRPMIAMGDWNAAALDDPALQTGTRDPLGRRKLDTDPALALLEAGLMDAGMYMGDLTATVGHTEGLAYRCDRIHTTHSRWIAAHDVIATSESDHALVIASFNVTAGKDTIASPPRSQE
ncbi:endonuclease/exonuclease/phosphatase family protein [Nonomuraea sp. NPDC003707]